MTVFYDSSALVKLYADEADADLIRDRTDIVVSAVARVEVPAAFWRKQRMGEIGPGDAQILAAAFEFDYHGSREREPRFVAIAAVAPVLDRAAAQCQVHGLRACDAVQLASAGEVRAIDPSLDTFAAFHVSLRTAAAAEGFTLLPPDR